MKVKDTIEIITVSREKERELDEKFGPDFKKAMNMIGDAINKLMMYFPMVLGHSPEAKYLQQPFMLMSEASRLCHRFGGDEAYRDREDRLLASLPGAIGALAGIAKKEEAK